MGYTDLLNRPNVYISYDGNDTAVIDNIGGGSLALVRTPSGSTATFSPANPKSEFNQCLVTQNQWQQSWTATGSPGDIYTNTNERWKESQESTGLSYEFWIRIPSSVTLSDTILLEWVESNETTRINLLSDGRISMTGPFTYTTFQGVGQNVTVYSDPLSLDEWHLVSFTAKALSIPPGTYSYVFEPKATSHLFVDGKIYRHSSMTSDANVKPLRMPNNLFSSISIPGIQIAHFAYWNTGMTHKHHVRRYMYGKAKISQAQLILDSDPWAYNRMNIDSATNTYPFEGRYVPTGQQSTQIVPSLESISNNAVDFNYQGGIEGTQGLRLTKLQGDPTLVNGAGGFNVSQSAPPNHFFYRWQNFGLNTGNYSIEFWYKNNMSAREYDSTASGVSPMLIGIVNGSVVSNIRLTNVGEVEYIVKLNNTASSQTTNVTTWSMAETGKRVDNEWHHLAIVSSYTNPVLNVKMYIDGALYSNYQNNNCQVLNSNYQVNPADPAQNVMALFFGSTQQYISNGEMDNLAFYDRALTESDVRSRYLNYNIVERPSFKGVKERKSYSQGGASVGTGYGVSTRNIFQPAENVFYHNGTTFTYPPPIKFYDGTNWIQVG